ncbi:lutropin subunit beta [Sarotherodon galilaeus]
MVLHTTLYFIHKTLRSKMKFQGAIWKTHVSKIQNTSGNCNHSNTHLKALTCKTEHQLANYKNMDGGRARGRGGRDRRGHARTHISDDIRATLVDHVINHGLTMREAGQRVHPHLSRFTVASVIRTFRLENRPSGGGRQRLFTQQQELAVVDLVRADNAIRLHQLRKTILADRQVFNNINHVSITTIRRILGKHSITMKQLYRRILAMDGAAQPHEFIFIDEAGFDLCKTRRRGRNLIGQRAIVHVPGQRGGNITLCAAISLRGLLHHHAKLGPYNSQHILTFLDALHNIVVQNSPDQPRFVEIWDNVSFHRAALVQAWFSNHNQLEVVYLPYSPFLNPIEEFFSAWRWRVYDRQPHVRMPLLQAMEQACSDIQVTAIHGWFGHARGYFPRCLAGEDIACDVNEVLWPDPNRRRDP